MSETRIEAERIEAICLAALTRHGASAGNAKAVARAIALAEAQDNSVCGLYYLPIFCAHLDCGKVDGQAAPAVVQEGGVIRVDARHGFAHPAIEAGLPLLAAAAREAGVAAMAVHNSYNCLALSHHVVPLADQGLLGLCVSNAPASVAPPSAGRPLFGTNPIAFAVRMPDGGMIVVDQSMSAVTKTEMVLRSQRGEPIPLGWAQDSSGAPTTDAAEGLKGSLLASGGQKGANLALLVEILAAALAGAKLSGEASLFSNNEGGPPGVGQFLLALDPAHFSGARFAESLAGIAGAYEAAGIRLPGSRQRGGGDAWRRAAVMVNGDLWQRARELAGR